MRHRDRAKVAAPPLAGVALLWCAVVILGLVAAPERASAWPREVKSVVHEGQRAMIYIPPDATEPVPLLVGLHSWSTDYRQSRGVPLAKWCIKHGWAFIHPNFQGGNRHPNATGSARAVQDVIDAIAYIKKQVPIDDDRIYGIGWSGGGMMGMLLAAHHPDIWAGISVWGPVTDMYTWYPHVERHRRHNYTSDMKKTFGAPPGVSPRIDALYKERSPITHIHKARGVPLDIQVGILDGNRKGPVPVSHSLRAFNILAADPADRFTDVEIAYIDLNGSLPRTMPAQQLDATGYGRYVPMYRRTSGPVRLTLFMGGHVYEPEPGLRWLAQQRRSQTLMRLGQQTLLEHFDGLAVQWRLLASAVAQILFGQVQGLVAALLL